MIVKNIFPEKNVNFDLKTAVHQLKSKNYWFYRKVPFYRNWVQNVKNTDHNFDPWVKPTNILINISSSQLDNSVN
jgi:hypothetical protein